MCRCPVCFSPCVGILCGSLLQMFGSLPSEYALSLSILLTICYRHLRMGFCVQNNWYHKAYLPLRACRHMLILVLGAAVRIHYPVPGPVLYDLQGSWT